MNSGTKTKIYNSYSVKPPCLINIQMNDKQLCKKYFSASFRREIINFWTYPNLQVVNYNFMYD